jgi:hypothetical protein
MKRGLAIFLTAAVHPVLGGSIAHAQDTFLADVRKSCSGYLEVKSKGTAGTIKFQNFDITVDAGNAIEISQEGVLLKKIEKFDAKDYVSCLKELATIMKDVQTTKDVQKK